MDMLFDSLSALWLFSYELINAALSRYFIFGGCMSKLGLLLDSSSGRLA